MKWCNGRNKSDVCLIIDQHHYIYIYIYIYIYTYTYIYITSYILNKNFCDAQMSSKRANTTATARLKQDYMRIKRDPVPYITAEPLPSNILEWSSITLLRFNIINRKPFDWRSWDSFCRYINLDIHICWSRGGIGITWNWCSMGALCHCLWDGKRCMLIIWWNYVKLLVQ